jgi:hypothetical protein
MRHRSASRATPRLIPCSNAYAEWLRQGSPEDPSLAQLNRLRARQGLELREPPARHDVALDGPLVLRFDLPLFGVSFLEVTPDRSSGPPLGRP